MSPPLSSDTPGVNLWKAAVLVALFLGTATAAVVLLLLFARDTTATVEDLGERDVRLAQLVGENRRLLEEADKTRQAQCAQLFNLQDALRDDERAYQLFSHVNLAQVAEDTGLPYTFLLAKMAADARDLSRDRATIEALKILDCPKEEP